MSTSMTEQVSRRMMMANPPQGVPQQIHKDVGDERYRDLRRARKLRFFVNGDRYFRGKKLYVTPNRYYNFTDLLNDLTGKLPSNLNLPYGVRQIFTPVGGRRIFDIEDLADGETYVCAGFEGFKTIKYGKAELEPWSMARPQQHGQQEQEGSDYYGGSYRYRGYANNAFHPGRYFRTNHSYQQRRWPGTFGNNAAAAAAQRAGGGGAYPISQSDNIPQKPKVVTIVRNGTKPRQNVKILLNRRSVQSFEQLLSDISEAFGPKYRQNKVRKLYTVRGREVHGISDFFRDDDCFIALGVGEAALVDTEVGEMLEELYPEGNVSKSLMKEWERNTRRRKRGGSPTGGSVKSHPNQTNNQQQLNNLHAGGAHHPADKRDSGFDSSDASTNRSEPDHSGPPGYRKAMNQRRKMARELEQRERAERDNKENQSETGSTSPAQHGYYLMRKLEKERMKAAAEEKDRAKRRQQKMADAEKRVSEEEKRKRGQVPLKNINDPFKKADDVREKEKDEIKKRKEDERRRKEEERIEMERRQKEKEKEERDFAEKAARDRMALAEREEKERQEKERVEREKQEKVDREKREREKLEKKKAEKEESKRQSKGGDKLPAIVNKDKEKQGKTLGTHKQTDGVNTIGVEPDNNNNEANAETASTTDQQPPAQQQKSDPETQSDNNNNKDAINKQQQKEKRRQEKEKEQQQKEKEKEAREPRKRAKTKIVRRTKAERQVANDEVIHQKYDLARKLGDGNFAIVRQSRKKETGHEYAIKVIDKAKLKGKEHMVENEIDIMKDCSHHNIVRLYEEYETTDRLYLVMELVKGGDLFDAITQSVKFGEVDSSLMVRDLGNALFYLHSRSIVHRDLKPENLLVHRNKDGSITLKLADFGLAMEVKELIYTVCGTPTYVAPEILTEIGYGLEVDMWAVGVITYILLCGFPPFRSPDRNQTELFEYIKAGEYEFLSPYWDNTSRDAKDLIQHLLVVDRKKRYTPVDMLSHKWVVCCGDTDRKPEGAHSIDQACKETRKELEGQAKLNYESYQRLKDKKRREREKGVAVED